MDEEMVGAAMAAALKEVTAKERASAQAGTRCDLASGWCGQEG